MKRIAIVGSGVAGLTAAWALRDAAHVTLFEADHRLGGHAHSHLMGRPDGTHDVVDTGYIVMNYSTYPTLVRLFEELGVKTQPAEMSMSVSCGGCGVEYAGARGIGGLLASGRSVSNRKYLRMLTEVPRFHRAARALLNSETQDDETFRMFLARNNFTQYFLDHYATPLVACVWSCPPDLALDYPARYLFAFLNNHGMLRIFGSPQWHTVVGGSREYVNRIATSVPEILCKTKITAITRLDGGVEVASSDGAVNTFDGAIVATHPDQALAMLTDSTPLEKEVLGAFRYTANLVQLNDDEALLPASPRARASWNYRSTTCDASASSSAAITYDMNRLQHIDSPSRYLVTLNAATTVQPSSVHKRIHYAHPQYTPVSVAAQRKLPELNTPQLAFAGAYHGWGFHEDGARSGAAAARILGARW